MQAHIDSGRCAAARTSIPARTLRLPLSARLQRCHTVCRHTSNVPSSFAPAASVLQSALKRRGCQCSSSAYQDGQPAADSRSSSQSQTTWLVLATAACGALCFAAYSYEPIRVALSNSVLGRSGFLASLSLIFLSELGDKTFFIAALLAMRLGKWVTFVGTTASLALMTVISVGIGVVCSKVPSLVKTSAPIGEWAGAALLIFFGIRSLRAAMKSEVEGEGELADAEEALSRAEQEGKVHTRRSWSSLFEVGSLIFIAEWGDRSMLATIALAVSSNPYGVAMGAITGHAVATVIAVICGALASRYISERTVSIVGGIMFLVFAAVTLLGIF